MAAFHTACASFVSRNLGAGNRSRIMKSYLISLTYSFVSAAIMGTLLLRFGREFLSIFASERPVIDAGMQRIGIMGMSYAVSAFMDCTIAASRGLGKSIPPTVIVIMGSCIFRIIWVYTIFAHFRTIPSLYLLYVFSWAITAAAEIFYYIVSYRRSCIPWLHKNCVCCVQTAHAFYRPASCLSRFPVLGIYDNPTASASAHPMGIDSQIPVTPITAESP